MGRILEETSHGNLPVSLRVIERQKGEIYQPWKIITFESDGFERMTPTELRQLGRWLMQEGRRIGREYTSKGANRAQSKAQGECADCGAIHAPGQNTLCDK